MRSVIRPLLMLALLASPLAASPRAGFDADLSRDPARAGFAIEGADDGRFAWTRGEGVTASLDSTQPGSRLVAPLGMTLDGTTSFEAEADLVLRRVVASPDDFFQISVGLMRSGVTGLNRTGTSLPGPPFFVDDSDTWDSVGVDYFPNVTAFGGPFLQPMAFGSAVGPAFANFAANFGPSADLGDNGPGEIRELPSGAPFRFSLSYDACSETLVTRVLDLSGDAPAELATGLLPLDLSVLNATGTFTVDALALHAYEDLADFDRGTRSLSAEVTLLRASVTRVAAPAIRVLPRALNDRPSAPARLLVESVPEGAPITLVESGGIPMDVPLASRSAGRGAIVEIDRALVAAPMTLRVGSCLVAVDAPPSAPR